MYRRKQYITHNSRKKEVCYYLLSQSKLLQNMLVDDSSLFIAISCPVTRQHQEHIILVPKEAQIQLLLWDFSKSWSNFQSFVTQQEGVLYFQVPQGLLKVPYKVVWRKLFLNSSLSPSLWKGAGHKYITRQGTKQRILRSHIHCCSYDSSGKPYCHSWDQSRHRSHQ